MWRAASWRQEPRLDVKVAALSKQRHDERLERLAAVQRALRAHLQPARGLAA